jgi:aminopeptidase N
MFRAHPQSRAGALLFALAAAVPTLAYAASAPLASSAPFAFDSAPGRLPKDVVPNAYAISITPDADAKTIAGTESVTLNVRRATSTLVFNSLDEVLADARFDGAPVSKIDTRDDLELTTLTLAKPAVPGHHLLTFAYTGKIETAPRGLFLQPYSMPGGGAGTLLSTQFEATDARRMFPCWDEPAFRATFTLAITAPSAWTAVSNMPIATRVEHGALATTSFLRTPPMPSYLAEFSAGDLAQISGRSGATKIGVWAVRGQEHTGNVALANAEQILADYNDYFGYAFPLPKLDSIAVPGGFAGAMENWGAITYNDQLLLVTPSSTVGQRQAIYSVQAHEMAHQWNGDLVTMGWWDDIWLNESFASWRSAKETDFRNPTWNWWEVQDADKEGAMDADARATSHPIEQHVTDELKALSAFDSRITYAKGQAVLRMLEAYLGPDTFRDGIRRYMKARAFSNATSADLWAALGAAAHQDVARIASRWIVQPGFPLVSVAARCDAAGRRTIDLSQTRFLLAGSDPANERWDIPLNIRAGEATPHPILLSDAGQSIAAGTCVEPLSVNAGGVGYYRVAYDAATLALNRQNFAKIPNADKIVMLDDQWALVESGAAKLPTYLRLAESMSGRLDARAWEQIAEALGTIEHDERGTVGYPAFTAYARALVKPVALRLGWDPAPNEPPGNTDLRDTVLLDLGAWGDAPTIAQARQRFAAFVANRDALSPDEQRSVLSIVAIDADQATFDGLHAIAKSARNETEARRYYGALMNVRDPTLAQEALDIALSSEIPQQAAALRLRLVRTAANYAPQRSWQTFTHNVNVLMGPMSGFGPLMLAQNIPQTYWNAVPLPELETWVKAHIPAELAPELSRGMEAARFSVAQQASLVPAADAYVAASGMRFQAGRR